MFCLFDIAATGRTDIGLATVVGSQTFDDIVALSTASKYINDCIPNGRIKNLSACLSKSLNAWYQSCVLLFLPVTCNPPCVNGACVANDTCNCAAGFIGDTCDETGMLVQK